MKKLLFLILVCFPLCSVAQNFNEDGGKYDVYCKVVYSTYGNSLYLVINDKGYVVIDKNGEKVKSKEVTEVLNLLSKRGWKLVSSSISDKSMKTDYHFIMKKEVMDDREIELGLKLKK